MTLVTATATRAERHLSAAHALADLTVRPLPQPMHWSIWDKGDFKQTLPELTAQLSRYDFREPTERRDALLAWASFLNVRRLTTGYGGGSLHATATHMGVHVDVWTEFTPKDHRDLRTWNPHRRGPGESSCIFGCGHLALPYDLNEHEQLDHVPCHVCHAVPIGNAGVAHANACTSPRRNQARRGADS